MELGNSNLVTPLYMDAPLEKPLLFLQYRPQNKIDQNQTTANCANIKQHIENG